MVFKKDLNEKIKSNHNLFVNQKIFIQQEALMSHLKYCLEPYMEKK